MRETTEPGKLTVRERLRAVMMTEMPRIVTVPLNLVPLASLAIILILILKTHQDHQERLQRVEEFMSAARNPDRVILELYGSYSNPTDVEITRPEDLDEFAEFMRETQAILFFDSNVDEATRTKALAHWMDSGGAHLTSFTLRLYKDEKEYATHVSPGGELSTAAMLDIDGDLGSVILDGFSASKLFEWLREAGLMKGGGTE